MASLSLKHVYKIYQGGVKAVNDFNLEIDDKEFIVFVGPSGCGKSTTLRMIAGLEEITEGELYIDDRFVNDVEPKDRDIAMVFQNYALYPHMTVFDNMAFGLKLRRMPMAEINARVKEAAAILGIEALLTRKPKALSGGQRQRVALGRAIVREPKVFLLDEPLSNLDAKLRVQMRTEITKLHHKLATTFIYVTHDQTEAMTMGSRIVVMKDGIMQQVDTPQNLYDYPVNLFVAGFIGTPQMNFIPAVLENSPKGLIVKFGANKILVPPSKAKRMTDEYYIGKEVMFGVRPEDIHDEEVFINTAPDAVIQAEIDVLEKLGNETMLYMKVDGKEENIIARVDARTSVKEGQKVKFAIDAKHIHMFDLDSELTVLGAPTYNFIPAYLIKKPEGMFVRIADLTLPLASDTESRIIHRDYINDKILVGIKPSNVIFDEAELANREDIVTGEVDFVEKFPREAIVYIKVEGKERLFAARTSLDREFKVGTKVKFAFSDIELFTLDRKRIRASRPVPYVNTFKTTATSAEGKNGKTVTYTVGKGKITIADKGSPTGEVTAWIAPSDIMTAKEDVHANAATTVRAIVEHVDKLGGEVILYTKIDGIDNPIVVRTTADCTAEDGTKIKLAFKAIAIDAGHTPPEAPEPKDFVEPAPVKKEKPAPAVEEAPAAAAAEEEEEKPAAKKPVAKRPAAKKPTTK